MRYKSVYKGWGSGNNSPGRRQRVRKDSARVEAYGAVDELNAWVGMIRTLFLNTETEAGQQLEPMIERIQHDLFDLGAYLTTPPESEYQPPGVSTEATKRLETSLDFLNEQLAPLVGLFCLEAAPWAHTSTLHGPYAAEPSGES